jgi:hypothetical protein
MRASNRLPAGSFCGGEIEPGTFHAKALLRTSDRVNRRDTAGPSPDISQSGSAQSLDATNAAVSTPEQAAATRS